MFIKQATNTNTNTNTNTLTVRGTRSKEDEPSRQESWAGGSEPQLWQVSEYFLPGCILFQKMIS